MDGTFKREYPTRPIIGVGGIIFSDKSVLIVKREKAPGRGQWSLPGGAVKLGETLKEALNREIYEELSIKIRIGGLAGLVDRIIYDNENRIRFHYVIADYWGWILSGRPRAGSDISEAKFVATDRLKEMDLNEEIIETIYRALKLSTSIGKQGDVL